MLIVLALAGGIYAWSVARAMRAAAWLAQNTRCGPHLIYYSLVAASRAAPLVAPLLVCYHGGKCHCTWCRCRRHQRRLTQ